MHALRSARVRSGVKSTTVTHTTSPETAQHPRRSLTRDPYRVSQDVPPRTWAPDTLGAARATGRHERQSLHGRVRRVFIPSAKSL